MKKVLAAMLALTLSMGMAACGDSGNSGGDKAETTTKAAETTTAAETEKPADETTTTTAKAEEETTTTTTAEPEPEDTELTQEKYDSMQPEDLLAMYVKDTTNVTPDEMVALTETLRFATLTNEPNDVYNIIREANITEKSFSLLDYKAKPELKEYIDKLLASEYPIVRGYAVQQMSSLVGTSNDDIQRVLKLVETETDEYVLREAVITLQNSLAKDPGVVDFMKKMAESDSPKIRNRVAIAFGNPWSKDVDGAIDEVLKLMQDENQDVRKTAIQYSGGLQDETIIEPIVEILNDPEQSKLHGACIEALEDMWYDYPIQEDTNEAAYNATMDYFKTTPRSENVPYWAAVGQFKMKSSTSYDTWKESATYFNTDDWYNVMVDIIKDPDANWMSRTAAIEEIKAHCSADQFASLKDIIDGLDAEADKNANHIVEKYEKLSAEE